MMLKLFGAVLTVLSCSGFGFYVAANHKREVYGLQKLIAIIELMEWELEYRLTPLPQLCIYISERTKLYFPAIFQSLSRALSYQISPDVATCMRSVLAEQKNVPANTLRYLELLGDSLGEYSMDGQVKSLASLRMLINKKLDELTENQTQRLHCYQTLGVCAGAALAILFI